MSSSLSDVLLGGDVEAGGGVVAVGGAGGWTLQLALAAGLGSLSAGLFGYGIGAPNLPQATIESDLGLADGGLAWSCVVASFTLSGFVGTQYSPLLVDRFGRRATAGRTQVVDRRDRTHRQRRRPRAHRAHHRSTGGRGAGTR